LYKIEHILGYMLSNSFKLGVQYLDGTVNAVDMKFEM